MKTYRGRLSALVILMFLVATGEGQEARTRGALLLAGGDVRHDNADVWKKFVELATRNKETRIVIIPAASGNPQRTADGMIALFRTYGAKAEALPVAPRWPGFSREVASDPKHVETVRKATGFWFTGGSQERITSALLETNGQRTPVLQAIWDAYRDGAVIGGSSAGLAIMAEEMITGGDPLDVLKLGMEKGTLKMEKIITPGLGFLGKGWLADQHFLVRGRFARMVYAMHELDYKFGLGVDEDTAVIYRDGTFEVVGYKGAVILDTTDARVDAKLPEFNIKGVKLTYLNHGYLCRVKSSSRVVEPKDVKDVQSILIDPLHKDFIPEWTGDPDVVSDMLGVWALHRAMVKSLDNRAGEVKGLAFRYGEQGPKKDLGFTFKVYRGKGTMGYCTTRGSFERYTVVDAYLDITPVRMASPLFTPIR